MVDWISKLTIGSRVVLRTSGTTGEIHKFTPRGVQVWVPDRGYERENWSWPMVTIRIPRSHPQGGEENPVVKIQRFPRTVMRFPRLKPQKIQRFPRLKIEKKKGQRNGKQIYSGKGR